MSRGAGASRAPGTADRRCGPFIFPP
ncbi:protein of unknown function [Cupriavidus neocaledonicus]|uniref:Uncharacterized protein n=1 Tax=Cupriavidus neocaledonicus TaxID=1040979 RepID=A0A375H7S7_9BURK|nr:protein of unknown function [Cupriavidus neocaledonicus]